MKFRTQSTPAMEYFPRPSGWCLKISASTHSTTSRSPFQRRRAVRQRRRRHHHAYTGDARRPNSCSANPDLRGPRQPSRDPEDQVLLRCDFANPLITPFPSSGGVEYTLTPLSRTLESPSPGQFAGHDQLRTSLWRRPYFLNIDPADAQAVSYLSQDLRVFTMTQARARCPVTPGAHFHQQHDTV